MLYAIVDIETTGGYASGNGITEIAIVIHDGKQILDSYETLINPRQKIPRFIQMLTGITDDMVASAPYFEEVAAHIYEKLSGKVFVAHNVNFDYSFVKAFLDKCGHAFDAPKLCTVRLSRKIIPGYPSYSLGKICGSLKINHQNRHRAGGDAFATAQLFTYLNERDEKGAIRQMLKGRNSEQYLPPNVPVSEIECLPSTPGIYYFYNASGKTIYIGKAKNILKRVKSHFSNNKPNKQKQDFLREINRISYTPCATDLMAHILESIEIRKTWPVHNRSQKGYLPKFGLYTYEDRQGFKRLIVEKNKNVLKPLYTFNTLIEGFNRLQEMAKEFDLCTRLCHISTVHEDAASCPVCTGTLPADAYNRMVDDAINWAGRYLSSFAVLDTGRSDNEQSCILIRQGNIAGIGYVPADISIDNINNLQQLLDPVQDNDYIRNMVYKYAADFPEKKVMLG